MHHFKFKKEQLYCENLKVYDLAQKFGTPLYLYSAKTIEDHFLKLKKAFSAINPLICYSVKANSNLSILKLLISKGAGLDIVSGGELYRAKKVKCPPKRIVYASVGKSDKEIKEAISYGILMFNVESLAELKRINKIAGQLKRKIDLALRFNPDISISTHKYITTGKRENKFGMDEAVIKEIYSNQSVYSNVNVKGIHIHIGSQITESAPFIKTIQKVKHLIKCLEKKDNKVSYLNIGGGLGIVYDKEKPQTAQEFADKVLPLFRDLSLKIILEPGRFIVGNAGILVTKVLYLKEAASKRFIIVDAAMNDLIRPSLYGAYHNIVPLVIRKNKNKSLKVADIVGPICESGDFLGKNRKIAVEEKDYLAVMGTGAYGFTMSSNYNSRLKAAEVLVKNNRPYLIGKREDYQDLIKRELII